MHLHMPESPDLATLAALFYAAPAEGPITSNFVVAELAVADLGRFARVDEASLPAGERQLLAHHSHMTVAMERFHNSPVDVEVLNRRTDGRHYSRKIRLRTQRMKRVVQFGLVRLNLDYLAPDVREEVVSERTPLGRVLINHGVLMQVRLTALWRIEPGPDLCRALEMPAPTTIYSRTAMIDFETQPAIELLEVSSPLVAK
ncbi:MAG: hypothetical protein QM775_32825 [Pirellulales bacterium]